MDNLCKKDRKNVVFAGLVAVLMIACIVPFTFSEDSDALTGNSNLSLNTSTIVLYADNTSSAHTYTFTVSGVPSAMEGNVVWTLNDLDDGTDLVTLSSTTGLSTTVTAVSTGSVEIEAYISGTTDYYASAVIVVFQSEGTATDDFWFFFQIDASAYAVATGETFKSSNFPSVGGKTIDEGYWVHVLQSSTGLSDSDFNALSALKWYADSNSWENDFGNYGWIQTFLGLGTYSGDDGVWYYWAQYHGTNSGWAFNNTTLQYITTEDSKFLGLIFWGSPSADDSPAWPGYPESSS